MALAIAMGGALGALARYAVGQWALRTWGADFPWGTLIVNGAGSVLMGLLFVLLYERSSLGPEWRGLLLVGFLGALTTYSSFAIESLMLLERGAVPLFAANVAANVLVSLGAVWLGVTLARAF